LSFEPVSTFGGGNSDTRLLIDFLTVDEIQNNDAALRTILSIPVAANSRYFGKCNFVYDTTVFADIKDTIIAPAGSNGFQCEGTTTTGIIARAIGANQTQNGNAQDENMELRFFIQTINSGFISFQFSQINAEVSNTVIRAGSTLWGFLLG